MQADATDVVFNNLFDAILIDAPCSGLGVIAHKHDLRYNIEQMTLIIYRYYKGYIKEYNAIY